MVAFNYSLESNFFTFYILNMHNACCSTGLEQAKWCALDPSAANKSQCNVVTHLFCVLMVYEKLQWPRYACLSFHIYFTSSQAITLNNTGKFLLKKKKKMGRFFCKYKQHLVVIGEEIGVGSHSERFIMLLLKLSTKSPPSSAPRPKKNIFLFPFDILTLSLRKALVGNST